VGGVDLRVDGIGDVERQAGRQAGIDEAEARTVGG